MIPEIKYFAWFFTGVLFAAVVNHYVDRILKNYEQQ